MRRLTSGMMNVVLVSLTACSGSGVGLDVNGRPIDEANGSGSGGGAAITATFNSLQVNVFTPICTACHAGASAPLGLRLTQGDAYAALVNAPSVEVSGLRRVTPGNPAASYLLQKISGSAAVGGRMPLGGPALPDDAIAAVRQWILDGAQPPVAAVSLASLAPAAAARARAIQPLQDGTLPLATATRNGAALVIAADAELDATSLAAPAITLLRSGGDGTFDDGNEVQVRALQIDLRTSTPTVFAITPLAPWLPDRYRLTVAGSGVLPVHDLAGVPLDGDGDGQAGGDLVLQFDVTDEGETR